MAVSFRPTAENAKWLDSIPNKNSFFNSLIEEMRRRDCPLCVAHGPNNVVTVERAEGAPDLQAQKDKLDIALKSVKIEHTKGKIQETVQRTRILTAQADYAENFGKPLSKNGASIMARAIGDESRAAGRFTCHLCGWEMTYTGYGEATARDLLEKHMMFEHQIVNGMKVLPE